jgi:4-alpha-glucanotransferase
MKFSRAAGILLHPTSLPGPYGIGDLGPSAFRFVDWLTSTGCKLWQVLPLGPTGYGDSPYQCFSAFAGNPYLISFDALIEDGLLTADDLAVMPEFNESRVDYGLLIPWKLGLLQKAFSRFSSAPEQFRNEFNAFRADNASWLDDYALFMSIKEARGGGAWGDWDESLRKREKSALERARREYAESILRNSFYQFMFFRQWEKLHAYANAHGIKIIGDIPIFVAYDSADVWANPDLFFLDNDGLPTVVAGVPPDYFSVTGQLWGNPLYRWDVHKNSGYSWWLERFRSVLKVVDVVRLDHFRGFAGQY